MATDTETSGPLRELHDANTYNALAYQPVGDGGPWPLLLYLHGAGEQGGPLRSILSEGATGTPVVSIHNGTALPVLVDNFVMVAPHTSRGWQPKVVSAFLDFLLSPEAGLRIDANRLIVTGHSMGGYGCLAAAAFDNRLAAAVPVAAAGAPVAKMLTSTAVWAFHGRNDVVCPSIISEELVKDLRQAGAHEEHSRLTLYDEAPSPLGWPHSIGHAATIPAYATPELYDWLLNLRRGLSTAPGAGGGQE